MATINEYEHSKEKLKECLNEIEAITSSPHSVFHLYVYQRLASVQSILSDGPGVEETLLKCVETAKKIYPRNKEDASKRFMW